MKGLGIIHKGERIVWWVLFGGVICFKRGPESRGGQWRGKIWEEFGGREKYNQNTLCENF